MCECYLPSILCASFFSRIDAGCADGAASRDKITDVRFDRVVLTRFQGLWFLAQRVYVLLILGFCVFGMVPPLCFTHLVYGAKQLGVNFRLRFELGLPRWCAFLGGRLANLVCLWVMIRLG